MRTTLYLTAGLAALAVLPQALVRNVLAGTAATLIEATPFLLLGIVLSKAPKLSGLAAYVGCGCTRGPAARSIPAACATWLLFGPFVAGARLIAGMVAARLIDGARTPTSSDGAESHAPSLVDELHALLPAAIIAAAALTVVPSSVIDHAGFAGQIGLGLILGFLAAPCALGAVAIAGALHATAPIASAAFLCVAGIVDLRALSGFHRHAARTADSFAMAIVAVVLCIVAVRHGASLVNPRASIVLGIAGVVVFALAIHNRSRGSLAASVAPAVMLAGTLLSAPAPIYHATETTLADLFVGEQLTFVGALDHERYADALIRFAITCCRADASPLVILLVQPISPIRSKWYRASGTIVRIGDELRLRADHIDRIPPPSDPFVYR